MQFCDKSNKNTGHIKEVRMDVETFNLQNEEVVNLIYLIKQFIFNKNYFSAWLNSYDYNLEFVKIFLKSFDDRIDKIMYTLETVEKLEIVQGQYFFDLVTNLSQNKIEFIKLSNLLKQELSHDQLQIICKEYIKLSDTLEIIISI